MIGIGCTLAGMNGHIRTLQHILTSHRMTNGPTHFSKHEKLFL